MNTSEKTALWHPIKAFLFILPSLALFLFFFLYPIGYSIYLSTTDANFFNFVSGFEYIGLANYKKILIEGEFIQPFIRTLYFIVTSVSLKLLLGLIFAALFSSPYLKFKNILYPLYLAPWALPWFFLVMIWRGMFNQDFGVINQLIESLGFQGINWLNDPTNAFITYNVVEAYLVYPFVMTVALAAIQSIPIEIQESAIMDGASQWKRFRYITLPLIQKPLLWATLITTIASFMIFGVPYLLNKGGPVGLNEFLLIFGYKRAFELGRYGFASAFMVIVFSVLVVLILLFSKTTKLTRGTID